MRQRFALALAGAALLALPASSFAQFYRPHPGDWIRPGLGEGYGNSGFGQNLPSWENFLYDGLSGSYRTPIAAAPVRTIAPMAPVDRGESLPAPRSVSQIRVRVPAAALVYFDDTPTRQTGADRLFVTPALDRRQSYSYEIAASWTQNGQTVRRTRTVQLIPGQTVDVDFNAEPPIQAAVAPTRRR